jgi:YebC/PmpR family DNA-binding regulatory protein
MSGHSKWATTKRQKAVVDAKKGAIFTKLGKLIAIAARKGGDPNTNFSLRMAIDKGRESNMPKENIERAIKRGTGDSGGTTIEELTYEGIGPAKAQFIIKCLTDNKNRSAAEIKHLFSKIGGSLSSVMWNFSQKGVIRIASDKLGSINKDEFELELIDNGAQDVISEEEGITIYTEPADLQKTKTFLDDKNIMAESAEIEYISKDTINLSEDERLQVEKFIDALDENEDVSDYYTNTDI